MHQHLSRRVKWGSLTLVLAVSAVALVELSAQPTAPLSTRLPALVVRDHGGTLVGHFAGVTSNGGNFFPIVVLQHGDDHIFFEVHDQNTLTNRRFTYYSNGDCTGTPYVEDPLTTTFLLGAYRLQGVNYTVGKGHELYRSSGTDAGSPTIGSKWDPTAEECTASSLPALPLENTQFVADLDTLFNFTSFNLGPI